MWYIHIMEKFSALKNEKNSAACESMNEAWGHNAKTG